MMCDKDYVIIGGGISGLYTAYRLAQREHIGNITVVEKLDRLGGRLLTEKKSEIIY